MLAIYSQMNYKLAYILSKYYILKGFSYFGHASADMKIDNVTSSRIWSRNSALAHASSGDSILVGFNWSQTTTYYENGLQDK
jgi:hypothetical protein